MADYKLFQNYVTTSAYRYAYYDTPKSSPSFARTSASVDEVSELNATDDTFLGYGVGDLLHFKLAGPQGVTTTKRVVGVTDVPNAVSVSGAVSVGTDGRQFSYQRWHNTVSADNDDGWFYCGDAEDKSVLITVHTLNSTNVTYIINGDIHGVSVQLDTGTITSATQVLIPVVENVRRLQVGLLQVGAGANDVSVYYRARAKEARP